MNFEKSSSDNVGIFDLLAEVNGCIDKVTDRIKDDYYFLGVKEILILTDLISMKSTIDSIYDLLLKEE